MVGGHHRVTHPLLTGAYSTIILILNFPDNLFRLLIGDFGAGYLGSSFSDTFSESGSVRIPTKVRSQKVWESLGTCQTSSVPFVKWCLFGPTSKGWTSANGKPDPRWRRDTLRPSFRKFLGWNVHPDRSVLVFRRLEYIIFLENPKGARVHVLKIQKSIFVFKFTTCDSATLMITRKEVETFLPFRGCWTTEIQLWSLSGGVCNRRLHRRLCCVNVDLRAMYVTISATVFQQLNFSCRCGST